MTINFGFNLGRNKKSPFSEEMINVGEGEGIKREINEDYSLNWQTLMRLSCCLRDV